MQKILHEPALPNTPSNTVTEVNTKKREREEKEDTEEKKTQEANQSLPRSNLVIIMTRDQHIILE